MKSHKYRRILGISLILVVLGATWQVLAQSESNSASRSQTEQVSNATLDSSESSNGQSHTNPGQESKVKEIVPIPSEKTLLQKIDGGFDEAVKVMAKFLFYRIGAKERKFITFERQEHFTRSVGSAAETPFVKHDPSGTYEKSSLSAHDVERLAAQGLLMTSGDEKKLSSGNH